MRKIATVGAGFLLLAVGLVLAIPGVPGPGLAIMLLGLILLAEHFHWARRARDWAREKAGRLWPRAGRPPGPTA